MSDQDLASMEKTVYFKKADFFSFFCLKHLVSMLVHRKIRVYLYTHCSGHKRPTQIISGYILEAFSAVF